MSPHKEIDEKKLPNSWIETQVNDVCWKITDGTHKTPNYQSNGIRFISIKNIRPFKPINWDNYEKYISNKEHRELIKRCKPEKDDVLFPRIGTLGFAKRIDFDQEVSIFVGLGLLKPIKRLIVPKYLEYYMNTPLINLLSHKKATGTGRKTLPLEETRKFPFMLAPLPEQHRIVAKIEELFTKLDAGVDALQLAQAQLKRYRQSVLKAAVEGRLTAEWRKQHLPALNNVRQAGKDELEPAVKQQERIQEEQKAKLGKKYIKLEQIDASDMPELPEGWEWTNFSHIGELNRGKSKHRPRNDPKLYNGDYPFVQTGDIRNANKFVRSHSQTYNEIGLKQSRLWSRGTLCITIAANIADTAILDFDACFPDSIVGFTPNQSCNIFFIEYFIRTAKENLNRYAPATAQKNINLKILSELLIPLPPKIEQDKIVDELDRIFSLADQLDSIIEIEIKRAQSLRQSILMRAFEGKLVPQDPNDLPASVLLERIKSEKAKPKISKQMEMF